MGELVQLSITVLPEKRRNKTQPQIKKYIKKHLPCFSDDILCRDNALLSPKYVVQTLLFQFV